jgi:hypothetical protein
VVSTNAITVVDGVADRIREAAAQDASIPKEIKGQWLKEKGTVRFGGKVYVPAECRAEVLSLVHDVPTAGHPGRDKTVKLLRRIYGWPGLEGEVAAYVALCDKCQRSKALLKKPAGPINPLPYRTARGSWWPGTM